MKAIILAGGFGTKLSEETNSRPKLMIDIGGKPILWHIMSIYAVHGISEETFVNPKRIVEMGRKAILLDYRRDRM